MQVNRALRDHYSALEELKADVTGLHNLTVLSGQGVFDDTFLRAAFAGHLADLFRAVRFGASEAHGKANLIQYNWLREKNVLQPAGATWTAELGAVMTAIRELATEVLTIEATGDYERAAAFVARYGSVGAELQSALGRLNGLPVDIRPVYAVREKLAGWN
jgi:hypothetical protein